MSRTLKAASLGNRSTSRQHFPEYYLLHAMLRCKKVTRCYVKLANPSPSEDASPHFSTCMQQFRKTHSLLISFTGVLLCAATASILFPQYASFTFETATAKTLAAGRHDHEGATRTIANLQKILIDDYLQWHQNTLYNAKRGNGSRTGVRTLIYRGDSGYGLGDRLRGLLHAYLFACFSERLLLIDWNNPFPLSRVFGDGMVTNFTYDPEVFAPKTLPDGCRDEVVVRTPNLANLTPALTENETVVFMAMTAPNWRAVPQIPKLYPDITVSRKLQAIMPFEVFPENFEFFPLMFKALFRPSPQLRKLISQPIAAHNRLSLSRLWDWRVPLKRIDSYHPYVSIHARLGHGVGEGHIPSLEKRFSLEKKGFTMNSTAKCMAIRAMELARMRGISNPPRFYLATDTVEFRGLLRDALLRQDKSARLMSGSWEVKHVKDLRNSVEGDLRRYMYTFMDLYVLSRGDSILFIESGFANLAIWMGGIRAQLLFSFTKC